MMVRNASRRLPLILLAIAAVTGAGCKKTPPAPAPTQEPPAVTRNENAEPVNETPMRPIVEERAAPAVSTMGAAAYNAQGLLKAIYFDFDRYDVRPDQKATLEANVSQLKGTLSRFNVLIEGHCDERGTNEYNMTLGDRRANSARQFLIDLGIPASRVRTISYGEERPSDGGHNEEGWARNRRAEFLLEEG